MEHRCLVGTMMTSPDDTKSDKLAVLCQLDWIYPYKLVMMEMLFKGLLTFVIVFI